MKLVIKAYLSKEKFFALPSDEQRKRAKNSDVYKRYLKEGKKAAPGQKERKKSSGNNPKRSEKGVGKADAEIKKFKKEVEDRVQHIEDRIWNNIGEEDDDLLMDSEDALDKLRTGDPDAIREVLKYDKVLLKKSNMTENVKNLLKVAEKNKGKSADSGKQSELNKLKKQLAEAEKAFVAARKKDPSSIGPYLKTMHNLESKIKKLRSK